MRICFSCASLALSSSKALVTLSFSRFALVSSLFRFLISSGVAPPPASLMRLSLTSSSIASKSSASVSRLKNFLTISNLSVTALADSTCSLRASSFLFAVFTSLVLALNSFLRTAILSLSSSDLKPRASISSSSVIMPQSPYLIYIDILCPLFSYYTTNVLNCQDFTNLQTLL